MQSQPEHSQQGLSHPSAMLQGIRHRNYKMAYSSTMNVALVTFLFIVRELQILSLLAVEDSDSIYQANPNLLMLHNVALYTVFSASQLAEGASLYVSVGLAVGQLLMLLLMFLPCHSKDVNRLSSKVLTIGNILLPIPTVLCFLDAGFDYQSSPQHAVGLTLALLALLLMLFNYAIYVNFHFAFSIKNATHNVLARFPNFWAKEFGWVCLAALYKIVLTFGFPNFFVIYLLLYLALACYEAKKYAVDFEYFEAKVNRNLGMLSLLSITVGLAVLSYFLGIELVMNSLTSFSIAFYLFFINFFLTFRKFWIKRIIIDDNTTTEISQITYVTTFIIFSIDKSQKKNQTYVSSLLKNHCNNCSELVCCCKNRESIYDPATGLSGKRKYQPHLDLVFVKHFYLKMIEDSILEFPKSLDIKMLLLLYYLEFLQLTPECIKHIKFFNRKLILDKLSVQQKFALFCLEEQFKAFVLRHNKAKGDKHVEKIKKFDQHFNGLVKKIIETTQNLTYFWETLNSLQCEGENREVSGQFLNVISTKTLKLTREIEEEYQRLKELNPSSTQLRDTMFFYSKEVVNDMDLFIRLKEDLKLEKMTRKDLPEREDSNLSVNIYGNETASLVVANINSIVWASNNAKLIFGYKKNSTLLKSVINSLMPPFFGATHDANVKKWLATGKCSKMNKSKMIWCRRENGACFRALIYIKVIVHFLSPAEKDIHYYTAIERVGNNEIICGHDGEIYGCDENFRNLMKCPIKTMQNCRPNIQVFFPGLFQHFFSYFYKEVGEGKRKVEERISGYIPGKVVDYVANFGKEKEGFMNKNRKSASFSQLYGMYLEIKMQEITMSIKGRFLTVDFEIERVDMLGRPLLAIRIHRIENDTVEAYFCQFEKTIKQILALKQKVDSKKDPLGATKKIENQGTSPIEIFLNPKRLKRMNDMDKETNKKIEGESKLSLMHRKQRAINQLVEIKSERVRDNIDRMKRALLDNKIISAHGYRILTESREDEDMYIFEEEDDYDGENEPDKTKTTMLAKQKSSHALMHEGTTSEGQLLDASLGESEGKFRSKDKDGVSFQESTASSAAFISLSTKIKLLKEKLWEVRPRRLLFLTHCLLVLLLVATLAINTYELVEQAGQTSRSNLAEQQTHSMLRLLESLMSCRLASGCQQNCSSLHNFQTLFEVIAYNQLQFMVGNGVKVDAEQLDFDPIAARLQLPSGATVSVADFMLREFQQVVDGTMESSFHLYGQCIGMLEQLTTQRSRETFRYSNSIYLLALFFLCQLLAVGNLRLSLRSIGRITRLFSQLYPQQKQKHMRVFSKLSKRIATVLNTAGLAEEERKARQECPGKLDISAERSRQKVGGGEQLGVCLRILLVFALVYASILASYGLMQSMDGSVRRESQQLDSIAINKLKLTHRLLTMQELTLNLTEDSPSAQQVLAGQIGMGARLINLYNANEQMKAVVAQYSASNMCGLFVPGPEGMGRLCESAHNGTYQRGILNGLQYIDQEINFYSSMPSPQEVQSMLPTSLVGSALCLHLVAQFFAHKADLFAHSYEIRLGLFGLLLGALALAGVLWGCAYREVGRLGSRHNCYLLMVPFDLLIENPYIRQYLMEELDFKSNIY